MKKKIICSVVVCSFLFIAFSTATGQTIETKEEAEESGLVELTIHIFKDKNGNNTQDFDETNAEVNGYTVEIMMPNLGFRFKKEVEPDTGSATFQVSKGSKWNLYGYEKNDWLLKNQWKGSKGILSGGITVDNDKTINIPLDFDERKSKSQGLFNTILANKLLRFIDNFLLIQQLLNL
jgi:hypothetical protein